MSKFEIKRSEDQYHFVLVAKNGRVILSSEMYESKAGAITGINSVKENSKLRNNFETKYSKDDKVYFVLKAGNGEVIGTSEMYERLSGVFKGISSVKVNAPKAAVYEVGMDPYKEEE